MLRRMPFYWYITLCCLHGGFLPRQILPGGFCAADFARRISSAADFFRGIFLRGRFCVADFFRGGFLPRLQVAICHCTSDVIGVMGRIWGAVIQLAMPPWLCFKCLFTLPVSCVMLQKSVKTSTPNFCTPSRDNNLLFISEFMIQTDLFTLFISAPLSTVRPVHLLRVFLLRVLESNFPGDSL